MQATCKQHTIIIKDGHQPIENILIGCAATQGGLWDEICSNGWAKTLSAEQFILFFESIDLL